MNFLKNISAILIITIGFFAYSCKDIKSVNSERNISESKNEQSDNQINKIPVLNFGTFHMGFTTDANKTRFDQNDKKNQKEVHAIAEKIAAFKPTVIIVENLPEFNDKLQGDYKSYIENPNMFIKNPSEVELLAFELGRLSGTKRIYGIDHKMSYNYLIAKDIDNQIDPAFVNTFYNDPLSYYPNVNVDENTLTLLEKLKLTNTNEYLDFLMTMNADVMTLVGTEGNFEGADEATKYYQRNLRMYSNLNRITLHKNDRVFILMGASHTGFFRDFLQRSPKFKLVDPFDYL